MVMYGISMAMSIYHLFLLFQMAYVCIFGSSKKKILGGSVEEVRTGIVERFPELQKVNFSISYFDEDVKEYLDLEDGYMPPRGTALRVAYEILASETEDVDMDSDKTYFDGKV